MLVMLLPTLIFSQQFESNISALEGELEALKLKELSIFEKIEEVRLDKIIYDLKEIGLPSENYIKHSAMCLEYDEHHEQPKWVAHIILPQVIDGQVIRTNEFMEDPLIKTGSAVEEDYFLKTLLDDDTYEYDGYGYDRGHIAPSADFRWSAKALAESYFYSNMSPQLPEFNREGWADLESFMRAYIYTNPESQLYIVTGPILNDDLPVVERSINKVTIPKYYFKVAIDLDKQQGIGFVMPNQKISYGLESFAKTIDEVEEMTGFDFFNKVATTTQNKIEGELNKEVWFRDLAGGDVEPISAPTLPKGHFNTTQSKLYIDSGNKISVCGTVVGTKISRKGHLWIELDKQFPNRAFTVFISKEDLINFSFNPEKELLNKKVCVRGKVGVFSGTPNMAITKESEIELYKVDN